MVDIMIKIIWNFFIVGILCNSLLLTNVHAQDKESVVTIVKNATTTTILDDQYKDIELYKTERQQDIVMFVIAQTTERLKACNQPPDVKAAIEAGKVFLKGEVAEYKEAVRLKKEIEKTLQEVVGETKQLAIFYQLRKSYHDILTSTRTKQTLRNLATDAFKNASALAAAEAVEDESARNSCQDMNTQKTDKGKDDANSMDMMKMACYAAAMIGCYMAFKADAPEWCAVGAVCLALSFLAKDDKKSCEQGAQATNTRIAERDTACNQLGTEDMFKTSEAPTTTASKFITDNCLHAGSTVSQGAGQGCQRHSSSGAGPYPTCDAALKAYERNMVACPVSVLTDALNANLESAGIASEVGKEFVATASKKISRALDLRMASPYQRAYVWEAFSDLAKEASDINKKMIEAIEKQLADLEKLIAELERLNKGTPTGKTTNTLAKNKTFLNGANITIGGNENTIPCTGNNCSAVADNFANTSGFENLPLQLQEATLNLAQNIDAINSGNIGRGSATSVLRTSTRNKAINDILARKKKLIENLKKKNGQNLDLNKETQNFKNSIKAISSNGAHINSKSSSAGHWSGSGGSENNINTNKDEKNGGPNFEYAPYARTNPLMLGTKSSDPNSSKSERNYGKKPQTEEELVNEKTIDEVIMARDKNSELYTSSEKTGLFEKITNAYIRNYDKLLTKKTLRPDTK